MRVRSCPFLPMEQAKTGLAVFRKGCVDWGWGALGSGVYWVLSINIPTRPKGAKLVH